MSLCDTPLPPACENEAIRLVALVPDADLAALAATDPAFKAGSFRPGNASALRLRVRQLITGTQTISGALRLQLARRSRSHTLTRLFSPEALAECRHALASLLGDQVLLVALLLDDRPDVRAKAEEWLRATPPFLTLSPDEAASKLRDTFSGLTELLGAAPAEGVAVTREVWREQKEKLDLRLRDALEQNRRLKGVDDRLANAASELKASREKADATQTKLALTEKALREKTRVSAETAAELERETARREERLAAALDVALAREFHGWLAQARAVRAEAADAQPAADLLVRADAALRAQGEVDRHSSNRAILRDRLIRLMDTHETVVSTLRNALNQSADLKRVEGELAAEIARLRRVLEPDAACTPLEDALVNRIHAAAGNDLPHLRDLPDQMASLRLLDDDALTRVRSAFQKRLAAVQAVGVAADPRTEERQGAVSLLGRALAGQTPAILLLDGHNILFGLPARYSPPRGGALSDADKRNRLTADIVRLTAPNPAVRAWIVFDGPKRHDTQAAANVRVTYSGGTGEHRADSVILDNIRFFTSTSPETAVLLVSNDADLCTAARRLGAQAIAVLDLGAFL
jgi:hypothetical protein